MLIERGARAVFAVGELAPDAEVDEFFAMVLERISTNASPPLALRDVRVQWLHAKKGEWVKNVTAFY